MYFTRTYLDRIQFVIFASQVKLRLILEDTHPTSRQQNWLFRTYNIFYRNLQLPDTIPTAVTFHDVNNKNNVTMYGLNCRSFHAWTEYFSICESFQTCCVTHDILKYSTKRRLCPRDKKGKAWKRNHSSASSTEVTSAWDNSHVHFSIRNLIIFCRTSRRSPYIRRQWSRCVLIHECNGVAGLNLNQNIDMQPLLFFCLVLTNLRWPYLKPRLN
jgi:hypothetical protein